MSVVPLYSCRNCSAVEFFCLVPRTALSKRSKISLFDHLIGADEQVGRSGDTQRSGSCEIEDAPQVRRGHREFDQLICSARYSASSPTPFRCADLNLWSHGSPRKYTPGTLVTPRLCRGICAAPMP